MNCWCVIYKSCFGTWDAGRENGHKLLYAMAKKLRVMVSFRFFPCMSNLWQIYELHVMVLARRKTFRRKFNQKTDLLHSNGKVKLTILSDFSGIFIFCSQYEVLLGILFIASFYDSKSLKKFFFSQKPILLSFFALNKIYSSYFFGFEPWTKKVQFILNRFGAVIQKFRGIYLLSTSRFLKSFLRIHAKINSCTWMNESQVSPSEENFKVRESKPPLKAEALQLIWISLFLRITFIHNMH